MSHFLTLQEIAALAQEEKFRASYELSRKLGTATGFFQYYFEMLPKTRTSAEAFEVTNTQYFEIFGEYRFSCFNSFLNSLRNHQKK